MLEASADASFALTRKRSAMTDFADLPTLLESSSAAMRVDALITVVEWRFYLSPSLSVLKGWDFSIQKGTLSAENNHFRICASSAILIRLGSAEYATVLARQAAWSGVAK